MQTMRTPVLLLPAKVNRARSNSVIAEHVYHLRVSFDVEQKS